MAKAANVSAVAVPGGYPNLDALRAAGPDAFVPTLSDVLNVTMR
jgi:phosphoglycolate phosphatase-like HAD superfamily hydrolase